MRTRVLSATLALVLSLALLAGCSDDNNSEWQRVVCEVELVNEGAPLVAANWEDGGDGIVPSVDDVRRFDAVPVSFRARPYSLNTMVIPEDDAFSSFILTGYNLTWENGLNVPVGLNLSAFNVRDGAFYLQVPVNEDAASAVMIADIALKDAIIAVGGGAWPATGDFTANARLEFIGHESGSQHVVHIDAGVFVTFTYAVAKD